MEEMTIEQQKALALMAMRQRAAQAGPAESQPTTEPQGQPQQQTAFGNFAASTRAATRGFTGGLSDYVDAAGRYAVDQFRAKPLYDSYNDALKGERADVDSYRNSNPVAAYSNEIAGGVVNPIFRGGAPAEGATTAARYAQYGKEGARVGAALGAGNAQGKGGGMPTIGDVAKSTSGGGIGGAALGVAVPAITEVSAKSANAAVNMFKSSVPHMSQEQFKTASQAAYKAVEDSGVVVSPDSFQKFVDELPANLKGLNRTETAQSISTPKTFAMLSDLKAEAANQKPLSLSALDELRSIASKGGISRDPHDAMLSGQIADRIDGYIETLKPHDLAGGGDPSAASDALSSARDLWRTYSKMKTVSDIVDTGDNLNDMNWVKGRFRSIVKSNQFKRFTPDEQRAISSIARTGTLEKIGKIIPWRGLQMTTTYAEPLAQNAKINALQGMIASGGRSPASIFGGSAQQIGQGAARFPLMPALSPFMTGGSNQRP